MHTYHERILVDSNRDSGALLVREQANSITAYGATATMLGKSRMSTVSLLTKSTTRMDSTDKTPAVSGRNLRSAV